jgi:DNA-binding transcriptional MerR regulator
VFTIGEMARICGVSTKTLRHYEAEGLLRPARVDERNQYRYYSPDQVLPLRRILVLRELGLSLEAIRRLAQSGAIVDGDRLHAVLQERAEAIRREIAERQVQLERLAAAMAAESVVTHQPVTVKQVEAQRVVSIRRITPVAEIPKLLAEVRRQVSRPAGHLICLYHNPEFDPDEVDAEALCPVVEGGWLLPQAQVAALVHEEPGHEIGRSYERLYRWIEEQGFTPIAPPREVVLSELHAEHLVIEIQVPIERRLTVSLCYVGNGAYCYANSVAMVLQARGHDVDPGYIECLTAFAISAQWIETPDGRMPFFDAPCSAPDQGVNLALRSLGYRYTHRCGAADGQTALSELRELLAHGPVIAGPVDMGLLGYNPNHTYGRGSDHYVVVYAVEPDRVWLHDPAGYPHAVMTPADFLAAWQAESITYKMGPYSMWGRLERVAEPTADELFQMTDRQIATQLRQERERFGVENVGPATIRQLAAQAADQLPPPVRGHLGYFAFPVSARRCEDFARFYAPYDGERSILKARQARCFGLAQSELMAKDYAGLSRTLFDLADLEAQFQELTLSAVPH